MPFQSKSQNQEPVQIELPSRQLTENLESLFGMTTRAGVPLGIQAEIVSAVEWSMDLSRAAEMREAMSLSEAEHTELLERFRQRNKQVWGGHSKTDW